MENFKHKTPIQIRFKDLDEMGHVNNANHLSYIELARLKYFKDVVGFNIDWNKQDGLILARVEIDFKRPIFFNDNIFVYTRCSRMGNKSFELSYVIVREKSSIGLDGKSLNEIVAESKTVLVCYDYIKKLSVKVPEDRKLKIEKFEGLVPYETNQD